jgi:ketosteroid isomerase-like protein
MIQSCRKALRALALALVLAATGLPLTPSFAGDAAMDKTEILKTIGTMTTAFAAGDINKVMATYEKQAVVVAKPGMPVGGEAELRRMFGEFVAAGVNFTYGAHDVVVAGDIGLHLMKWTAPGPEGPMTALSVAVLRRQADGSWKMVIDHPFGDAVMK